MIYMLYQAYAVRCMALIGILTAHDSQGSIYLTWKGKAGNTGVDLADVSHVSRGSAE